MPRMSWKEKVDELEKRYEAALATIERMSRDQMVMAQQLGVAHRSYAPSGQLVVGVRNVSNYTVGLIDNTSGRAIEYQLYPEVEGHHDPRTRAVVSFAYWQELRKGSLVGRGLIVRDDSVLGPSDGAAPPDRPEDVHPDHFKNLVLDPREWILSKSEDELRDAIGTMTSEPSLRRLMYAVDMEIVRIGQEKYGGDPDRARKSIRDLPAIFRIVDELADERLDDLNPVSKVRHLEVETIQARRAARV
jgi:hypothetical protein